MEWLRNQFELARGSGGHNIRAMEGMRGFAVFLVFLVHYATLFEPWIATQSSLYTLAGMLHSIGNAGVDLFFVLSGYLIYGSLISRPQGFFRFMARRVQRIYPAFIAVFLIYCALSWAFPEHSKIPASMFDGTLYLLQNFLLLPGLFPIQPMITVAWSLSYEIFFYLGIPLLISLLGLRRRSVAWRVTFFIIVAGVTALYCAVNGGPIRMIMFVSGILLFETVQMGRTRAPGSGFALLALALGLLGTLLPLPGSIGVALRISILFAAFFVLCFTCFTDPRRWITRLFSWTPMRWLGNMSYSYYLLQGLVLKISFMALALVLPATAQGLLFFGALMPVMFAITLIPTAALFILIERPFSLRPRRASCGFESTVARLA